MKLFPYRKETDPELIAAATAAYAEAPPARNTRRNGFSRTLNPDATPSEVSSRRDAGDTDIPA